MINPNVETIKLNGTKTDERVRITLSAVENMKVAPVATGGSAKDYNLLGHKPSINEVVLVGNKTGKQLGLQDKMDSLTNKELDDIIKF